MFNLIKDDFDESIDDIMDSIDKILNDRDGERFSKVEGKEDW